MHFNYVRREKCFFISAKVVCHHKKCYYCIGNLVNMTDESPSLESFIAGLYDGAIKLGVYEESTCNLHPVVEPLSWTLCFHPPPLRMLCCIWFVALVLHSPLLLAEERKSTFFSCTRENLPLFCARWTCFVCHGSQLSCYVSKLFMLCYKWGEWTNTALRHSSKGWIVWVDRKHSFMGSFSLATRNGQLSF